MGLKQIVGSLVPSWREAYWRWDNRLRVETEALVYQRAAGRVLAGPFVGMRYVPRSSGSAFAAKILGTYEKELVPFIEEVIQQNPAYIVDVGAAEGYYAVGLLTRLAKARCIAFEMTVAAQVLMKQMAEANGVEQRIEAHGYCDAAHLKRALCGASGVPVVIMDVEGAEMLLLDQEIVPELSACRILVELHDHMVPGCFDTVLGRFRESHHIEIIESRPRSMADVTNPLGIAPWRLKRILPERPVVMRWFAMEPFMAMDKRIA